MIEVRKLAALDITLHGTVLIFIEFIAGVAIPAALGVFTLARGIAVWQVWLGIYLIGLALNYVPLLVWALAIGSRRRAREILEANAQDEMAARRYTAWSFLLLIPLAIFLLALVQAPVTRKTP